MNIAQAFLSQSRRYLVDEYPTKIQRCLDVLPPGALWHRANETSNSIGNLLLHLSGNVRQWIVSGVGGASDVRHRSAEFDAVDGADASTLMSALRATLSEVDRVLASLDEATLASPCAIQGREVTAFEAVYHVVEHFSMHTGQIILLTKQAAEGQVKFYEDAGGMAKPVWR